MLDSEGCGWRGHLSLPEKLNYFLWLDGARQTFLTRRLLERFLVDAGFEVPAPAGRTVYHSTAICELDARFGESFYLEGVK